MKNSDQTVKLTKKGLEDLQKELKSLYKKKEKLQKIKGDMASQGDVSENDGYTLTISLIEDTVNRIAEIQETLDKAEVVSQVSSDHVDVGTEVTVEDPEGKTQTFLIVGETEADPINHKITIQSPIGSALHMKKTGDQISITTPAGEAIYTIKEIKSL